jgi:flavin reductase (DIM6/NTAB) family NADH-FMN oxidoreductase RutF
VNEQQYRLAAARLPAGVAVLTVAWRGAIHAATVSSAVSLSMEPALIGVSLHRDSRIREALEDAATWSISVLSDQQPGVAEWLASPGRPVVGQLDRVDTRAAEQSDAVWLEGAAAWFDCRTEEVWPTGDHDLVVGQVLVAREGAATAGALVHLRGRLRRVR